MSKEEHKEMDVDADEDEDENNSSSSDNDDEEDHMLVSRAEELERSISSNKYFYDAHVEIVDLYRKLGDLNSMREAYERFHACFPLTPKLWLDWIKDEIRIANTPDEQKRIMKLFDKAVEDYLSVDLWIEYAQYSIGVSNLQTTRSILERAITATGLHVVDGHLLWDTLRELEHAHISLYQKDSEEWKAQVLTLADVFKRQLSVPLLGMENTYKEWQEWYSMLPDGLYDAKPVEWGYKKAVKTLEIYKPFEEQLLTVESSEEIYEIYKEYLKVIKDISTAICLYERAIVTLCLIPHVWVDYCMYVFKLGETVLKVSGRALRNCPWSEELWIIRLRILESQGKEENEVLHAFEQGVSNLSGASSLELWLTYLEFVRRNNSNTSKLYKLFTQAMEQLNESDMSCKVARFYARLLAKGGDMVSARKIWGNILSNPNNKASPNFWLEFVSLERQYGEPIQVRNLFRRALTTCVDWQLCIYDEWLLYERENGSLDDVIKCCEAAKKLIKVPTTSTPPEYEGSKEVHFEKNKKRKNERFEELTHQKRLRIDRDVEKKPAVAQKHIEKNPKTTVFVSNLHVSVNEANLKELFPNAIGIEIVRDKRGKSRCYGYIQFSKEEEVMTALAKDRVPIDGRPVFISELKPERTERKSAFKYSAGVESNKLFVRGLPITKTKEDIEEIFRPYGAKDVRLITKKSGESKGIAYVEFENDEAAQKALKATDRLKVDDCIINVAISAPPPKNVKKPEPSEPVRHARSRLSVPLIPRALQVKTGETTNGAGGSDAKPKTNADFRNMLLKK